MVVLKGLFKKGLIFKFLCWEGVVVLKELIFNSFYFGSVWCLERTVWVVLKELIFNSFYVGRVWFPLWVLKELIFNSFYFGRVWWS